MLNWILFIGGSFLFIKTYGTEKAMLIYKEKFPNKNIENIDHFIKIIQGKLAWVAAVKGNKDKTYIQLLKTLKMALRNSSHAYQ